MKLDLVVFANGRGGKHRDTPQAAFWRHTVTTSANHTQDQYPGMSRAIALSYAELATAVAVSEQILLEGLG